MIPSLSEVRGRIDATSEAQARYALKLTYLTACRANELCGISQKGDIRVKADGTPMWKSHALSPSKACLTFDTYEGVEVMKLNLGVLKRREEVSKIVALPMDEREPWAKPIANYISTLDPGQPILPFPRWKLAYWIKFSGLSMEGKGNPLRHMRINHLTTYYGFDGDDRTIYAGWTFGGPRMAGPQSEYLNLDWQEYFPKLLKPLPQNAPLSQVSTT